MLKKVSLLFTLMTVLVLSSCSSKMKDMKPEFFTATPEVLEVIGNEVPVTIDGKFPAKFFNKKAILTITPVLKYKDGEAIAESSTFQGENIRGNDKTISYENGGNFRMRMTFDYTPQMEKAELYLRFSVNKGNKTTTLPEVKLPTDVSQHHSYTDRPLQQRTSHGARMRSSVSSSRPKRQIYFS